ncbi:hypothetical protein BV379_02275 [Rhodovulum sulfidophilum]|nr:hypothetical protein BV379_02275 [Rhodovulum sulfidophilum]
MHNAARDQRQILAIALPVGGARQIARCDDDALDCGPAIAAQHRPFGPNLASRPRARPPTAS